MNTGNLASGLKKSLTTKHAIKNLKKPIYMSNQTVEQRIAILCEFNSEKIKEVKELMQEDAISFGNFIDLNLYRCVGKDGDWRELNGAPVANSTKKLYELYNQTITTQP